MDLQIHLFSVLFLTDSDELLRKVKLRGCKAFPELRAPDIFYRVYLSVTCVFQPLSLVPYAQNSSITSGFGSHRFAKFDADHLHKVKPHPFLLIDVMMTNQTLSSTFRKEELL